MKNYFTKLHYAKQATFVEKILILSLIPVSSVYATVANIRNFLYKKNIIKSYKPKALTISVGNLTTGGTGKTPITAKIANHLTQKGYKVAILSRGYGSKLNSKNINIISDGNRIYYNAQTGGDEPVMLAENCPNVTVLTSSNRIQIAKHAEKMGCNALILDDGFQHLKLKRDVNIAIIDIDKQFGNKKVLPAGPLRESYKNIKRADKIIIVNKNIEKPTKKNLNELFDFLKNLNNCATISICNTNIDKIYEIHTGENINSIQNKKILAFSAIGQPEQFYNLLKQNGFNLNKTISFPDHHNYNYADIETINNEFVSSNADAIITTEKDAVKIKNLTQKAIYALKLGIDWDAETIL